MKQIHTTFIFESSKGGKFYRTLLYEDGSTSCDCPGWTRRTQPDGSRVCRHTTDVIGGIASSTAHKIIGSQMARALTAPMPQMQPVFTTKSGRAFDLDL